MSREAIQNALDDAGITFDSVEAAVSSYYNDDVCEQLVIECRFCVW